MSYDKPVDVQSKANELFNVKTKSVTAGLGRYVGYGMPPPTSNDTGTAFCFPN